MATATPSVSASSKGEPRDDWIGSDDRGVELEITAVQATDLRSDETILLVLHVMPTALRRKDRP